MPPNKILAVCLDCGNTLIDEATELKTDGDVSLKADLIPGAAQLVRLLKLRPFALALVVDDPVATFENNLKPHDLYRLFEKSPAFPHRK